MASTVLPTVMYTKASISTTSDQDMASSVELTEPSSKKADTLITSMWVNNDTAHCFLPPCHYPGTCITNWSIFFVCIYLINLKLFSHTQTHQFFFFNFSVVRSTYLLMKIIKPLRQNNKFRNLKKGNLFRSFCWRATVQDSKSPPKLKQRPKVEIPEIRPLS